MAFAAAVFRCRYRRHSHIKSNKAKYGEVYSGEKYKNPFFHNLKRPGIELIYSIFCYYNECNIFFAQGEKFVGVQKIIYSILENDRIVDIIYYLFRQI